MMMMMMMMMSRQLLLSSSAIDLHMLAVPQLTVSIRQVQYYGPQPYWLMRIVATTECAEQQQSAHINLSVAMPPTASLNATGGGPPRQHS
jgi:hypothetical protein